MGILKCHSNSDLTVYYAVYGLVHVITLMACVRKGAMGAWYMWNLRTSHLAPANIQNLNTTGTQGF